VPCLQTRRNLQSESTLHGLAEACPAANAASRKSRARPKRGMRTLRCRIDFIDWIPRAPSIPSALRPRFLPHGNCRTPMDGKSPMMYIESGRRWSLRGSIAWPGLFYRRASPPPPSWLRARRTLARLIRSARAAASAEQGLAFRPRRPRPQRRPPRSLRLRPRLRPRRSLWLQRRLRLPRLHRPLPSRSTAFAIATAQAA
jgi:hypothetical protein